MSLIKRNEIENKGSENIILQDINHSNISISLGRKEDDLSVLKLYILTSTKQMFEKSEYEISGLELNGYYDNDLKSWKPFRKDETIESVLIEFGQESGFTVQGFCISEDLLADPEFLAIIEDGELEKHIIIIDGISTCIDTHREFVDVVDKSLVGGVIIPVSENYGEKFTRFVQKQIQENFTKLHRHFFKKYTRAYIHLELQVPNKKLFFRRLSNIAIEKLKRRPKRANKLEEKFQKRMNKFNIPDTKDVK